MALPFFAITLFVSAFLLFLVQPMIGKMILPRLGGTPQVWNTCMVFFQMALLAGYAYTHTVSSRFNLRRQLIIHGCLLFIPLLVLLPHGPFNISDWIPPPGENPIPSTLLLLTAVVGIPFFVVATSAPLLQNWFARTGHAAAKDPYFLYGASNLGSMLALLAYPVVVEPYLVLSGQAWMWTIGYVLLVLMFLGCVAMVWSVPPQVLLSGVGTASAPAEEKSTAAPEPAAQAATAVTAAAPAASASRSTGIRRGSKQRARHLTRPAAPAAAPTPTPAHVEKIRPDVMTIGRRLRWVALAAIPTSFMLGVTTYMSTDVSAIAMFWIIPLALYLLSFILVFLRWPVRWTGQPHTMMVVAQPFLILGLTFILLTHRVSPIYRSAALSVLAFFLTALVCHGELARDRPGTKHLTEFYLWMSVGGMLGGMFNALLAPQIFTGLVEFPLAVAAACLVRPMANYLTPMERPLGIILGGLAGVFLGFLVWGILGAILGIAVGALIGFLYQPNQQNEGWTEQTLLSLFPRFGPWLDTKGKELARGVAPSEETPAVDRPRVRSVTTPNYYLLSYALDIFLPILVGLLVVLFLWHGSSEKGWNWKGGFYGISTPEEISESLKNPLFAFGYRTLGLKVETALSFGDALANVLIYGVPILLCFLFAPRPLRFGLAVGAVLLVNGIYENTQSDERVLERDRSYFGLLKVLRDDLRREVVRPGEAEILKVPVYTKAPYHYLMHGTTHHGLNYQSPPALRRLATTYYHRKGPVGVIMERFNWFPGPQNTYWADARLSASVAAIGLGMDPMAQLVDLWSEPPYACVGLGTGTMASYSRPFQHLAIYEIDQHIRNFHLPPGGGEGYFNYVQDALKRGADVEIIMGDARLSMQQEEKQNEAYYPHREGYYHALELDAFSSDAIPVHLITLESIQMYMDKLVPGGVLMVHTSNRHVNLVKPVTDVAKKLGLAYRVANDAGERGTRGSGERGHFQSEYVMIAREEKYLPPETPPEELQRDPRDQEGGARGPSITWTTPPAPGSRVWTDDYSNLLSVFRWGFGQE